MDAATTKLIEARVQLALTEALVDLGASETNVSVQVRDVDTAPHMLIAVAAVVGFADYVKMTGPVAVAGTVSAA